MINENNQHQIFMLKATQTRTLPELDQLNAARHLHFPGLSALVYI
jgi:hypothetical protein